jgi:Flp pilus assembly protein TadD
MEALINEVGAEGSRAVEAIYAIGHTLLEQQRAVEAAKVFRVMLRIVPSDERGWLGLGACHEEMDDLDIASELYGTGWTVSQPPSARCLYALSRIVRLLGDRASADDYCAEAFAVANDQGVEIGGAR